MHPSIVYKLRGATSERRRRPSVTPYIGVFVSGEEVALRLHLGSGAGGGASSATVTPFGSPRAPRRDPSILKRGGSFRTRRTPAEPPNVTFNVENEEDSDDSQITFSARPRAGAAPRSRPSSLLVALEDVPDTPSLSARSLSVEDSTKTGSPAIDLKLRSLRKTAAILRKVSSAEKLSRLKDKIMARGSGSRERSPPRDDPVSDDESAPLVSPTVSRRFGPPDDGGGSTSSAVPSLPSGDAPTPTPMGGDAVVSPRDHDATLSAELSPRSDVTELESSPSSDARFDVPPPRKANEGRAHAPRRLERNDSVSSLSNMMEPYNMRLLAHGTSEGGRALWRQDALDSGPPWPPDDPDSAV